MDLAPGLIDSNVIGSGLSNLLAVSGSKYFHKSCGMDPLTVENHMWKCSGPLRTTSLAVAEAIVYSGVAATAAQRSQKGVC